MRTQVGIIRGGPVALLSSALLALQVVDYVTPESLMTSMLHRSGDDFDAELRLAQLKRSAPLRLWRKLAENYTHLPFRH